MPEIEVTREGEREGGREEGANCRFVNGPFLGATEGRACQHANKKMYTPSPQDTGLLFLFP